MSAEHGAHGVDPNLYKPVIASAATSGASGVWILLESLAAHGFTLQALAPLLLATASLLTAYSAFKQRAQEMRQAEELHKVRLEAERRKLLIVTDVKAE